MQKKAFFGLFLSLLSIMFIFSTVNAITIPLSFDNVTQYIKSIIITDNGGQSGTEFIQINPNGSGKIYINTGNVGYDNSVGIKTLGLTSNGEITTTEDKILTESQVDNFVNNNGYITGGGLPAENDPIWNSEKSDYYTRTEVDTNIYNKAQSDSKYLTTEVDPIRNSDKTNYYTKTESNATFLKGYTESDPTVPNYVKGLTPTQFAQRDNGYYRGYLRMVHSGDYVTLTGDQQIFGEKIFENDVIVNGNFYVNGTKTIINSDTVNVKDKNILLGVLSGGGSSDITSDGAGITVTGDTNKTFNWMNGNDARNSSENMNLVVGRQYMINNSNIIGNTVLTSTTLGASQQAIRNYAEPTFINVGETEDSLLNNTLDTTEIENRSILSEDIATGEIKSVNIGVGEVTTNEILNGTIINNDMANNSISTNNIINDTITDADIFDNSLTALSLANNSVTNDELDNSDDFVMNSLSTTTNLSVGNNLTVGNTIFTDTLNVTDKITVGTIEALTGILTTLVYKTVGQINVQGDLLPTDTTYRDIGSLTETWNNVFVENIKKLVSLLFDSGAEITTSGIHFNMNGGRIENIANANSNDDAVNRGYADSRYINVGESADSLQDGTLDSSEIENETILSEDILNGIITAADLGVNSVGASEIATNAVTTTEILNDTITENDISNAFIARNSDRLDGHDTSYFQRRVSSTCAVGSSIRIINANGTVTCEVDTDTNTNTRRPVSNLQAVTTVGSTTTTNITAEAVQKILKSKDFGIFFVKSISIKN